MIRHENAEFLPRYLYMTKLIAINNTTATPALPLVFTTDDVCVFPRAPCPSSILHGNVNLILHGEVKRLHV